MGIISDMTTTTLVSEERVNGRPLGGLDRELEGRDAQTKHFLYSDSEKEKESCYQSKN